ncbi:MAG: cytochrome c class I [bacterium]|nr:MAG: cytochrome c class I [bacterium]KAF0150064.1 MAG: cytochrome c class I [bacterium]KAF0169172.1 MAG: cytochrome c class I [bacterium]TXT17180.1 MAG: cytochrome c class I [bacterium]
MIRRSFLAIAVLAGLGPCLSAQASDNPRVRLLASTCVTCHGPGGQSLGAVPSLAGQEKAYLQEAMMEQRAGKRETTVMRKYMNGFTPEEIGQLAEYFSKLK